MTTVTAKCVKCGTGFEVRSPTDGKVWDSLATCPHCNTMFFKTVDADKLTLTYRLSELKDSVEVAE